MGFNGRSSCAGDFLYFGKGGKNGDQTSTDCCGSKHASVCQNQNVWGF